MDAFPVEERLELVGNASVVDESAAADVSRGNDSTARQLPDVELVDITHALHLHTSHPHTRTHSRTDAHDTAGLLPTQAVLSVDPVVS